MSAFLRRRGLVFAAIIAVSVLMHLKGLGSPMLDYHHHRQCNTAAIARNYYENGLHFFSPQIDWEGAYRGRSATEFPLYMWLMGLLWPVFGLGDLWGRVLSIVFSALSAVTLFKFLERKMEAEPAFYASLFFSCIPLEIYFGRTVQPEAIALFGTVAAFYHWDKFLADKSWRDWALAILFSFLAIAHKLPYAYLLLPLAVLSGRQLKTSRVLIAPLLALAGVYAWYHYAATSQIYVVPSRASEFMGLLTYQHLPRYISFQLLSRFPELACTYGGLILMGFGALEWVRRRRECRPQSRFFAAWFLFVAAGIIAGGGYSFSHEYTSLPFALVNAAFMGMGFYRLRGRAVGARPWARAGLVLLALSVPIHATLRISHWYRLSHPFLKYARKAADAVSRPDDLFVCNERASSVFLYYMHRRGWSWDLAEGGEEKFAMLPKRIDQGAKFYVTEKTPGFERREGLYAKFLYAHYPVVYDADDILIFRLRSSEPASP